MPTSPNSNSNSFWRTGRRMHTKADFPSLTVRSTSKQAQSDWRLSSRIRETVCAPVCTEGCGLQYGRSRALCWYHQRAVIDLQGTKQLAVVDDSSTVKIRPVKVAETIGTEWIISEGVKPGERVIVEGVQRVRQGMQVSPKPYVKILH